MNVGGVRVVVPDDRCRRPSATHAAPGGDLGMPEIDARVGLVELEAGLFMVLSLAPPAELEAAWTEAAPIVASVSLADR